MHFKGLVLINYCPVRGHALIIWCS